MRGIVVKGIGGFYFVETADGTFRAKGRGAIKRSCGPIFVGDDVELTLKGGEDCSVIEKIYTRKNFFFRPPAANVDRFLIVAAAKDPKPNMFVIDKFLAMAIKNGAAAALCINKADLADDEELDLLIKTYTGICPVFVTAAERREGIDTIIPFVSGGRTALAGPSGVGKSTITNLLSPGAGMETGNVSCRTSRGRNTTRHVEMFGAFGGYIFDTPGFTSFDMSRVEENELGSLFPEIDKYAAMCRFDDCMHLTEPGCEVLRALSDGMIARSRYDSYTAALFEIRKNRRY